MQLTLNPDGWYFKSQDLALVLGAHLSPRLLDGIFLPVTPIRKRRLKTRIFASEFSKKKQDGLKALLAVNHIVTDTVELLIIPFVDRHIRKWIAMQDGIHQPGSLLLLPDRLSLKLRFKIQQTPLVPSNQRANGKRIEFHPCHWARCDRLNILLHFKSPFPPTRRGKDKTIIPKTPRLRLHATSFILIGPA